MVTAGPEQYKKRPKCRVSKYLKVINQDNKQIKYNLLHFLAKFTFTMTGKTKFKFEF